MKISLNNKSGFTLLEILIALFIFSIVSLMLVGGLHTVINAQTGTETKAERLRELQMTLLVMSRDIEQAVNRPIVNADGKEEAAFVGNENNFQFTHLGYANTPYTKTHGSLQRTGYAFNENLLSRLTWPALDQAPKTKAEIRPLLNVTEVRFQYLDQQGHFRDKWPMDDDTSQPLPRAVRINLTIPHWGKITQLYLIPADFAKKDENIPNQKNNNPDKKPDSKS